MKLNDHWGKGIATLIISQHEDVANRQVSADLLQDNRLENLTISRLPALTVAFDPIRLSGSGKETKLRLGAGVGHYVEDPTSVSRLRGQVWGIVDTPHLKLGALEAYGELGARSAFYGSSTHGTYATQVTLATKRKSDVYANVSLLHRRESGFSPFLFDRVLVPDELYTEVELPLWKKSPLRLDVVNRQDLSRGHSTQLLTTLSFRGDCLSYGITYNSASKGFGLGMVLNGFGNFRHGAGSIGFTQ